MKKHYCYVADWNVPAVWYGYGETKEEALKKTVAILEETKKEFSIEDGDIYIRYDLLPCCEVTEDAYNQLVNGNFDNLLISEDINTCKHYIYVGLRLEAFNTLCRGKKIALVKEDHIHVGDFSGFNFGFSVGDKTFYCPDIEKKSDNTIIVDNEYSVYVLEESIELATEEAVISAFADGVLYEHAGYIDEFGISWTGQALKDAIHNSSVDYDDFIGFYYRVS